MLVGDICAQEDGLGLDKEIIGAQERGLEPNEEDRETREKRFNSSRMLDGETDFQEMELRTSKMLKGDIGAHEEGFTRLGREARAARVKGICTERLIGATMRIQNCRSIFFQERREERGEPREDRSMSRIRNLVKLENQHSMGKLSSCCHDTNTSAHWAKHTGKFYISDTSAQWAGRWSNPTILGRKDVTACSTRLPGHAMTQDGHAWGGGVREDVVMSGASAALCSTLCDWHSS